MVQLPEPPLSGKARRQLRARGHHLRPVVLVGKESLSDALLEATGMALFDHELVKIKLSENTDGDRHELAAELAHKTGAQLVGLIGRTFLLYRQRPEDAKKKPAAKPGATVVKRADPRAKKSSAKPVKKPRRAPHG